MSLIPGELYYVYKKEEGDAQLIHEQYIENQVLNYNPLYEKTKQHLHFANRTKTMMFYVLYKNKKMVIWEFEHAPQYEFIKI